MIGGHIMLAGGLLFVVNLLTLYRGSEADRQMHYAVAVYPPERVPRALNGFALCNVLILFLMLMAYGYPIGQFFFIKSYPALVHRVDGEG